MKRKTERNVDWESIRIMLAIFFSISVGGTFCFTSRVAEEGALGRAWPMILILIGITTLFGVPYFIIRRKKRTWKEDLNNFNNEKDRI
jgi:hypothetical protein